MYNEQVKYIFNIYSENNVKFMCVECELKKV